MNFKFNFEFCLCVDVILTCEEFTGGGQLASTCMLRDAIVWCMQTVAKWSDLTLEKNGQDSYFRYQALSSKCQSDSIREYVTIIADVHDVVYSYREKKSPIIQYNAAKCTIYNINQGFI